MTTTINLADLCNPDGMLLVRKPRDIIVDGQPAVFATDGRCGLLLFDYPPCGNDLAELGDRAGSVEKIINGERKWIGSVLASDVRQWAGEYEPPKLGPCDSCGGDGRCECQQCNAHHDCGVCKGSGKQTSFPDPREGIIGKNVLDRNKVAEVFRDLQGRCEVGVGLSAPSEKNSTRNAILEFRGDGWRAYFALMDRTIDVPHGDWPVLELVAEAGR